jgi:hypothetical protein
MAHNSKGVKRKARNASDSRELAESYQEENAGWAGNLLKSQVCLSPLLVAALVLRDTLFQMRGVHRQ